MKLHVGTSGFGYKEWIGSFYPEKTSPKEMLRFYSEHLKAVEINNTFYHMPTVELLASWLKQVPDDFIFAFKAPQVITHFKKLRNVGEETDYLFKTLSILDTRLGPVLFQFPRSFHADYDALKDFLAQLPGNIQFAFEFRNPSWLNDEILSLLRDGEHSLCIADTDENPKEKIISTAKWGYFRLRRSDYEDADLAQWRKRIGSEKWKQAFVFFEHEDKARGPELAIRFRELAQKKGRNAA